MALKRLPLWFCCLSLGLTWTAHSAEHAANRATPTPPLVGLPMKGTTKPVSPTAEPASTVTPTPVVATAPPTNVVPPPAAVPLPAAAPPKEETERLVYPVKTLTAPRSLGTDLSRDERHFPRYPELKPAALFWKRVFGEFSENQSVIHCAAYPHKIVTVLDLSDEAERMNRFAFAKYRDLEEKRTKEHLITVLEEVHAKRQNPSVMDSEQRRLYDLFADIKDDNRFRRASETLRAQRGLKERTQQALDLSVRYLPTMESTFKNYQLPVSLTRLPLVESSFNVEAYSKAGAAGLWQFIPSSARIYMRLNELVDDRRDPWTSTDAAARHLRDDYATLGDWPLAITAYNYGRSGIMRALNTVNGTTLVDLIERFESDRFGFASKNYYAEFLGALDVDREYRKRNSRSDHDPLLFDVVETKHYVPYETLRQLCGADDELFRKLNPAYRPEVIQGRLFVPPRHLIRIPAGKAQSFAVGYEKLTVNERFDSQRMYYLLHKVGRGDSLGKIARNYSVSPAAVLAANGLGDSRKPLRIGQVLKIPPHVERRPGPIALAVGESVPAQTRAQRKAELEETRVKLHTVKAGQTLSGIAKQYRVSLAALRGANKLKENSRIKPGMKLKIPASG